MRSVLAFVGFLCVAAPVSGQTTGWIDVNFGSATPAQKSLPTETNIPDGGGEFETFRVGYNSPRGASFDFGGGVMFSKLLGAGIQFTGTAHEGEADLAIRIPHPRFFNAYASDSALTDEKLMRSEGSVNLSIVGMIPSSSRSFTAKFFAGPTYFRLKADAVNNIRYTQVFSFFSSANVVNITSWDSEEVEQSGWGFHVGGDVGFFFTKNFGVGGFARLTRGTVTFSSDDFLIDDDLDVKVGGVQAGGGIRIRF